MFISKGQARAGALRAGKLGTPSHTRERKVGAKRSLTNEKAGQIKRALLTQPRKAVAEAFGVPLHVVEDVAQGVTYRNVPVGPP